MTKPYEPEPIDDHIVLLSSETNQFRGFSQEEQDDYYAYLWTLEGAWYKKLYFGLPGLFIAIGLGVLLAYGIDLATQLDTSLTPAEIDAMPLADIWANLAIVKANLDTKTVWNDWVSLPGTMLIQSLACLVVPMVFVNVTVGIADLATLQKAAHVGARLALLIGVTSLLSALLGTTLAAAVPESLFQTAASFNTMKFGRGGFKGMVQAKLACPNNTNSSLGVLPSGAMACGDFTTPLGIIDVDKVFVPATSFHTATARPSGADIVFNLLDTLVSDSFVGAFVANSALVSVVVLAIPLGLALSQHDATSNPILDVLRQLNSILLIMIGWVINFVPLAVVFLVASSFVLPEDPTFPRDLFKNQRAGNFTRGPVPPGQVANLRQMLKMATVRQASFFDNFGAAAQGMGLLLTVTAVGTLVHCYVVLPALTFLATRRNPMAFIGQLKKPLHFGFGSASSLAALPMLVQAIDASHTVSRQLTRFVVPVATGIHMDGAAFYLASCTVFLMKSQPEKGLVEDVFDLTWANSTTIVLAAVIMSWSVAPIPHGGLVGLSALWFAAVSDAPPANFVWVVAMDVLLDRFSTYTNIMSNAVVTRIIAEQIDETYVDEQDRLDATHAGTTHGDL